MNLSALRHFLHYNSRHGSCDLFSHSNFSRMRVEMALKKYSFVKKVKETQKVPNFLSEFKVVNFLEVFIDESEYICDSLANDINLNEIKNILRKYALKEIVTIVFINKVS